MSADDIMRRSGFVEESQLTDLVTGDADSVASPAGAGSPAIITAITAVSAFITSTGLCPTFACTKQCTK
ncbi:class II lanthipeptide, LchA2/BrtA2 family [Microbacterium sp.]|uniref:class II lanthipeptide, LchA2/BrtA2 family n=1 Tax=Microbacterium sp. TaxID=51671 RepID=UPI003340A16D